MYTKQIKGMPALKREVRQDLRTIRRRVLNATYEAAKLGRILAKDLAPIAFKELSQGIIAFRTKEGAIVRSTAPHSGAVEHGSRPHTPPIEPLIAWVKLRGKQGLSSRKRKFKSTAEHRSRAADLRVAASIRALSDTVTTRRGRAKVVSTPIDAAEQVARAIQFAIAKNGTKPTFFMKQAVPEVERVVHSLIEIDLEAPLRSQDA